MIPLYNKPHVTKFLSSNFMQFIIINIQNLCWTLERLLGRSIIDEDYKKKIQQGQSWLAADYKRLMVAHENFVSRQSRNLDPGIDKNINIAVIIPSRLARSDQDGDFIFKNAIKSIRSQKNISNVCFSIIISVDFDAQDPEYDGSDDVIFVKSSGNLQSLALNTGIDNIPKRSDYVAILEDDDQWHPEYVSFALAALSFSDFVSSNQLERNETGDIIRVFDFPTPSGWMMPISVLNRVGKFDTSFKWHLDNEWLGRLGSSGLNRCHMVECNAPTTIHAADGRMGVSNVLIYGGKRSFIYRHVQESPLVYRMMHSQSGMHSIRTEASAALKSDQEHLKLVARYGYMPW